MQPFLQISPFVVSLKGAKGDGSIWLLITKLKSSEGINLHCFCLC